MSGAGGKRQAEMQGGSERYGGYNNEAGTSESQGSGQVAPRQATAAQMARRK